MTIWKKGTTFVAVTGLMFTLAAATPAQAARKGGSAGPKISDPDAPTPQEAKMLGYGPVKTPNRGKNPEFLVRGVVVSVDKAEGGKHLLKLLPIEVAENLQRSVTIENFKNGLDLTLSIPSSKMKELKPGHVVEYHQHYTTKVEQSIGGASMVAYAMNQDLQGYPVSPVAYLKKPDLYPEQYLNALRGLKTFNGSLSGDQELKAALDVQASSAKLPELKSMAGEQLASIFQAQATGKCKVDAAAQKFACGK